MTYGGTVRSDWELTVTARQRLTVIAVIVAANLITNNLKGNSLDLQLLVSPRALALLAS